MRNLRVLGAPKLRTPTFSNISTKKPSQIPLIQKPKKTLQNLIPHPSSKSKVLPVSTLKIPKPPASNTNIKPESKDTLILTTNPSLLPHSKVPSSNINTKNNFNPNNNIHYDSQQSTLKTSSKQISLQTFPSSKMKSLQSYANTASSTDNSEQNNTAFHNNIHKENDYSSFKKVDLFKNNIFLNKILLCINSLVTPKCSEKDLCKNPELIQKLISLENKNNAIEEKMKLQHLNKDVNIINADMIQSSNQIAFESEQRKEIYQNYFDFYFDICKDIKTLAQQFEKQSCINNDIYNNENNYNRHINELKKIDEVNSKLSSLHSVINFSKTESQVLNYNNNINGGINQNIYNNNNIKNSTIPRPPGSIHNTFNFNINNSCKSNNTQTLLVSSLGSEFYQKMIEESFKNEINHFFSIYEEEHIRNFDNKNENNISVDSSATMKCEFHVSTSQRKINILNGHNRSKTDIDILNKNNNIIIKRTNYSCNSSGSGDIIYNDDSDSTIIDKEESNDTYYQIPTQAAMINKGIHLTITPLKKERNVKAITQTTPSPPPKLISPNQKDNTNCIIF